MSGSSLSRATSISFMLGIVVAGCGHESQEQPAEPTAPEVRTTAAQNVLTNSIGMELILVPAGEFMMGGRESPDELINAFGREAVNPSYAPAEHPLHRVRITKPFYLGAHEVTKGQFRQLVQATGCKAEAERNVTGAIGMDPKNRPSTCILLTMTFAARPGGYRGRSTSSRKVECPLCLISPSKNKFRRG